MLQITTPLDAVVTSGQFSTRTGPLSTQAGTDNKLRDRLFV